MNRDALNAAAECERYADAYWTHGTRESRITARTLLQAARTLTAGMEPTPFRETVRSPATVQPLRVRNAA